MRAIFGFPDFAGIAGHSPKEYSIVDDMLVHTHALFSVSVARPSSRNGGNGVGSGGAASLESAAFHLLAAGAGCIALTVMRLFKRQSRSLKDACGKRLSGRAVQTPC